MSKSNEHKLFFLSIHFCNQSQNSPRTFRHHIILCIRWQHWQYRRTVRVLIWQICIIFITIAVIKLVQIVYSWICWSQTHSGCFVLSVDYHTKQMTHNFSISDFSEYTISISSAIDTAIDLLFVWGPIRSVTSFQWTNLPSIHHDWTVLSSGRGE